MSFIDFNTIIPQNPIEKTAVPPSETQSCTSLIRSSISTTLSTKQDCALSPKLSTLLTHNCAPMHSLNRIKFADDTTVVGLISKNDESAYGLEVQPLVDGCRAKNLPLNVD